MTNAQIIFDAQQELAKQGILKYNGRTFAAVDGAGNPVELKEVEPIHTFAAWKEYGYSVKKGEHAKAQITIWKHGKARTVTDEDGNETEKPARMFMKLAYFFTFDQVEPIAARA